MSMEKKENFDFKNGKAAFILPFWNNGNQQGRDFLKLTIDSIFKQSDPNWHIYITDDFSESETDKIFLSELEKKHPDTITITYLAENSGPGRARNESVYKAYADLCPFICWLDSDDIASPDRVKNTREIYLNNPKVDVIYSSFSVIDEYGNAVPIENCLHDIRTIVSDIENEPLEGYNTWIKQVTQRDTITIPSSLNVKTEIANRILFPEAPYGEDVPTWVKYSAHGCYFYYDKNSPTFYRIPQNSIGSSIRVKAGGLEPYNRNRILQDTNGVDIAIDLSLKNKIITEQEALKIKDTFLRKLANEMRAMGLNSLYDELILKADSL